MKTAAWPGISDGTGPLTISWSYDNAGRKKTVSWSNGISSQSLASNYTFKYHKADIEAKKEL